jgi:hypothetical protein
MKHFLLFFLLIPTLVFSQVPQGVGYQAVATDLNGVELINQAISIQASVISSSATGTIEWQETHNTSTDTFGLFNLTIGQGTSTGNGAQTSFADISWGTNTHFLKIEMDVLGGTNYSFMGTNQMMSVPYALYAESSGDNIWNKDSVNNISYLNGNVNIGSNTIDSSAVLNINSVSQGIMLPNMTETQRDSINNPTTGLLVFQNDGTVGFYYYSGVEWTLIGATVGSTEFDPTLIYITDGF